MSDPQEAATPSDPHSAEAEEREAWAAFVAGHASRDAEVAELKAKIADAGPKSEWGIALDVDHIRSATSWGIDEAGARHRASKYRDYVVVKRVYGQDDDAWVAVCDHYEDCPNLVVAGSKYCGNHDPYRSASSPVESVIRWDNGVEYVSAERGYGVWMVAGSDNNLDSNEVTLPATVLFTPTGKETE